MPRSHGLDGQLFDAFPGVGHDHVHPIGSDRLVIEGPSDLERGVAFGDHALDRDQVPGVHWLVAERDRRDLRRDCEQPATRPRSESRVRSKEYVECSKNKCEKRGDGLAGGKVSMGNFVRCML